jgi:hypothetical protein
LKLSASSTAQHIAGAARQREVFVKQAESQTKVAMAKFLRSSHDPHQ